MWTAATSYYGYGALNVGGENTRAHRLSWEINVGPIPEGKYVLHRCDTPACVNPAHLFLGTHADNMHDMWAKGRHAPGRGATPGNAHHQAKLRREWIDAIRAERAAGMTFVALGKKYGVTESTMRSAVYGKTWQ